MFSLVALCGCGSPDTSYIKEYRQFTLACGYCRVYKPMEVSNLCDREGEHCEKLCSGEMSAEKGLSNDKQMCRCSDSNDIWIFDPNAKTVELRQAPVDDYGNEIR